MATTVVAVLVLLGVHVFVAPAGYILVLAAMVAGAGLIMASGYAAVRQGRVRSAVAHLAIANYTVALGATTIAPFAMPVLLMATMLPAVLAVPYVGRAELRTYVVASFLAAFGVAALGSVQDVSGLTDQLPGWIPPAVVVLFTPFLAAMVALVALTNGTVLDDAHAARASAVSAAERARDRMERDLHDGAQQALLGAAVRLAAARSIAGGSDRRLDTELDAARGSLQHAIRQLRDLAHGLHPVALTEGGLAAALRHEVARSPAPVIARLGVSERYPPEVERDVYFCCVEALHNAFKHGGQDATISLAVEADGSTLRFEVLDDGRGFDPTTPVSGVGFDNMTARLAGVGGRLEVTSSIGGGTRVIGVVPARPLLPQDDRSCTTLTLG